MITTIYGLMDEADLDRRQGVDEDDRARIHWVEYWKGEELVHRSVHVEFKHGLDQLLELEDL